MTAELHIRFIPSISQIDQLIWSELVETDYPFIQYEFLEALEKSGSTSAETGWLVNHLIIECHNKVVGLMPLYIKNNSYGEYIFDFQWANAYHQAGLQYYPKIVTAIPFTPCTGQRIYINKQFERQAVIALIAETLINLSSTNNISSWHCLFVDKIESEYLASVKISQRLSCQYHWFNDNYQSFDDFLSRCKNKSRKNIKQQRKRVLSQGFKIKQLAGEQISSEVWQSFYTFYQLTNAKKSGHMGYLNQTFFELIAKELKHSIVMNVAYLNENIIATALFFKDSKTLYGRYWGCIEEFDFLHFELCYYQGIEYCINHQLQKFDAGAQGEHKISRGFVPIETYSNHWIGDPIFNPLILNYIKQEQSLVKQEIESLKQKLPFKNKDSSN